MIFQRKEVFGDCVQLYKYSQIESTNDFLIDFTYKSKPFDIKAFIYMNFDFKCYFKSA